MRKRAETAVVGDSDAWPVIELFLRCGVKIKTKRFTRRRNTINVVSNPRAFPEHTAQIYGDTQLTWWHESFLLKFQRHPF